MKGGAYLPTVAELLHFAFWIGIAAVLIFVAIRQNNAIRHRHENAVVSGPPPASAPPMPLVLEPAPAPASSGRGIGAPRGAALTPVIQQSSGGGFNPRHESNGDARLPNPAELAYVRRLLTEAAQRGLAYHPVNWDRARELAATAAGFRYVPGNDGWVLPEETWARGYGDCQAKSLYLAVRLLESGYRGVGLRFGCPPNYRPGQPGHVWPIIDRDDGEIVFEPTSSSNFFTPSTAPTRRYNVTATVFPDSPN